VLQNDKYIDYVADNAVDVIVESSLDEGIKKNDPKAATYDAKDEKGNVVKLMKSWPNMTLDEMYAMASSPASSYSSTGIPYTAIVDPFTLKEMKGFLGGQSSKMLIEEIGIAKAALNKDHGASIKRSTLQKYEAALKDVEASLTKEGAAKAMEAFRKLDASLGKDAASLQARGKKVEEAILAGATKQLDDAEAKIKAGDAKAAVAVLKPLAPALKGTALEARTKDLLAKANPAEAK
jgi:hypothetical protein